MQVRIFQGVRAVSVLFHSHLKSELLTLRRKSEEGVEKFDRFPRLLLDIKRPENDMIPPLGATVEKSSYDLKEHSRLRIVFCSKYSLFSSKSIDISKKKN